MAEYECIECGEVWNSTAESHECLGRYNKYDIAAAELKAARAVLAAMGADDDMWLNVGNSAYSLPDVSNEHLRAVIEKGKDAG